MSQTTDQLIQASRRLSRAVNKLKFSDPVSVTYNPLQYAREPHENFLSMAKPNPDILFMGMNPGPWGMAQIGVPFGEIEHARDWLKISGKISKPKPEHPKRPVEGFGCARSEVSGRRLWGLFRDRFETPSAFFEHHFITNYCPLVFMAESARNVTPDKLVAAEREPLEAACDAHVKEVIRVLNPAALVGVGAYAENALRRVAGERQVFRILHPSPASPAANRDWAGTASKQLKEAGLWD